MMPEYFQTCISCDDPIEVRFSCVHICEQCRREMGDDTPLREPIIACCLYQEESIEKDTPLGAH